MLLILFSLEIVVELGVEYIGYEHVAGSVSYSDRRLCVFNSSLRGNSAGPENGDLALVNVNGIAPGYIATDNTAALRADPVRSRQILERIPAGRWGEASDIAGACVFLCSPASDYINGVVLPVDGGWLAR